MAHADGDGPVTVLKAVADPVRWEILTQIGRAGELACTLLEDILPVSKPTISYHTKILHQANLISTRRVGRNAFYVLRPDALRAAIGELTGLLPPAPPPAAFAEPQAATAAAPTADAADERPQRLPTW
ncbi:MAG: metalloregulator ArsR/SmtB family transcription factor [Microbacterium sp.]